MASTADTDVAAVSPAQIAALSVSIFAILVFTSISVYLYGRRKGCKEATQQATHNVAYLDHHHHHPHTRMSDKATPRDSMTDQPGMSRRGRLVRLMKQALGIKVATAGGGATAEEASSSSSAEKEQDVEAPRTRTTSPLRIGVQPDTSNRYSGTEEFQAAVHNLLGHRPDELQEWYSESDDDAHEQQLQQEQEEEGSFAAMGPFGSPLPPYQEVAETESHRFSWQGQESDYRPEKR